MTPEFVTVAIEDGVGIITLNRPEKLNAMNNQLSNEMHEAVRELNANPDVGCVVLTGTGNRGVFRRRRHSRAKGKRRQVHPRRVGRPQRRALPGELRTQRLRQAHHRHD